MTDETREREVPDGFRLEWVEEGDDWAISELPDSKRCKFTVAFRTYCNEPSAAALRRGRQRPQWWHYCANHLYGRRINEGRVEVQVLVADPEGTDKP